MTTATTRRDLMADMAVDIPEGVHGGVAVERFEVTRDSIENIRLEWEPGGRGCEPGTYTKITHGGTLWMSDTTAERRDHMTPALALTGWRPDRGYEAPAERVLVGGLGLGMILRVALLTPGMRHVDVVEINWDIIALVGPHYEAMAAERGVTLTIHHADMHDIRWPTGTRWDVAWFDIWPHLCTDDLDDHARLARSYARRTGWYGCWGHELLLMQRRRESTRWGW